MTLLCSMSSCRSYTWIPRANNRWQRWRVAQRHGWHVAIARNNHAHAHSPPPRPQQFPEHAADWNEIGHRNGDFAAGLANERHEYPRHPALRPARAGGEKLNRVAAIRIEHLVDPPDRAAIAPPQMLPVPQPLEIVGDLALLRPNQPHVQIAPTGRGGEISPLDVGGRRDPALVDDVHAAEIGHAIVDRQQFAMVSPVEDPQEGKPPEIVADRMKGMNFTPPAKSRSK